MPPLPQLLAEVLPVAGLLVLLVTAFRHPRSAVEAGVAVVATALALLPGLWGHGQLSVHHTGRSVADLAPVVIFLATILVVAQVCEEAGLFAATARFLQPRGARPAVLLLTSSFLLAAAVTAVLSLDATIVLLTPVALVAARGARLSSRPAAFACLRMANSSSLLLPVSNLTNLLALPHLDYSFLGFAAATAPIFVVVLASEYVVLRLLFRAELRPSAAGAGAEGAEDEAVEGAGAGDAEAAPARPADVPLPRVPATVVAVMLAGFAITSPFGIEPAWVSGAAALVLAVWGRRLLPWRGVLQAAQVPFALFVLALGVVVAAISTGPVGDLVTHLVPGSTSYAGLLGVAVLATVLANLLTNLSATLLVVPLVAPLGDAAVLAALIGLNVGSGLTPVGSLANLLWNRSLGHHDEHVPVRAFLRVSLVATPVTVLTAVTTLWLTT